MTSRPTSACRRRTACPPTVSPVAVAEATVPLRRPMTMVWSGTSRSPSEEWSNIARTNRLSALVCPTANTRVTEVCQVMPSSESSMARSRLVVVGSTAGAAMVTSTSLVGTNVVRTRSSRVTVGVRSSTTTEPPTVSTDRAGSSSSRISAAMPSTGRPLQTLPVRVLSTEWRTSPVWPSRSLLWTGRCLRPDLHAVAAQARRRCWSAPRRSSTRRRTGRLPPCRRG